MAKRNNKITEYLKLDCPFVGIPDDTILSPELNALSSESRWLYMVLLTKFDRKKTHIKKEYQFKYKEMSEITGYDNRRLSACTKELEKADFMEIVHGGKNNPSLYRPVLKWLC